MHPSSSALPLCPPRWLPACRRSYHTLPFLLLRSSLHCPTQLSLCARPPHCPACRRYYHMLPFLLLRSSLRTWLAVTVMVGIEVRATSRTACSTACLPYCCHLPATTCLGITQSAHQDWV